MNFNQDYLLDENGDLLIKDGDFVVGPSDDQHIEDIIQSFPGEWKQFPIIGCAIIADIKTQHPQNTMNKIKTQLQSGGYQLDRLSVTIENGVLKVKFPEGIQKNA